MSGSKEERPTTAGETAEPEADETSAQEAAVADEPTPAPETAAELTAAEALAQATEAAEAASEPPPAETAESALAAEPVAAIEVEQNADAAALAPEPDGAASPSGEPDSDRQPQAAVEDGAEGAEAATVPPRAATSKPEADTPATATPEPLEPPVSEVTVTEATESATAEPEAGTPEAATPATAAPATAAPAAETPQTETPATETPAIATPAETAPPERPEMRAVLEAMSNRQPLEGRVIGWNNGGFHLALGELSAFCPRSEMEVGDIEEPESYLDRTFLFRVLRLQGKGRRIVVSRAAHLRKEHSRQRNELRKRLKPGTELDGTVASLTDFGAFVDLGGAQGLVHVSEISHRRVEHPSHVLSEGQEVRVKVLKVEQGGRRISLSIRALEPDPWKDLAERFPRGAVVKGTVEKANQFGAFIELAPGLTGLLPAKSMSIPRETSPARAYPPGKEVSVQIVSVDPRRQRISLALEGSGLEGSRTDFQDFKRQSHETGEGEGFNALASAFRRLQGDAD